MRAFLTGEHDLQTIETLPWIWLNDALFIPAAPKEVAVLIDKDWHDNDNYAIRAMAGG